MAALGAAGLRLALGEGRGRVAAAPASSAPCSGELRHLSWVWQFSQDSSPEYIVPVLAAHNLGIALKTHDGTDWMAEYDTSPYAVSGPEQTELLARYFEGYGVQFHAWAVVRGLEPEREAEMCAAVLAAGARSIILDLEPWHGFWVGTPNDALTFGAELRRRQPNAVVKTALDSRPWVTTRVPVAEFASFSNAFAPLIYWETFNDQPNVEKFLASGWPPGPSGITPEFLLDVTASILGPYNLPIQPVGQGASPDMNAWARFLDHAFPLGMKAVSAWRYGVTDPEVWRLLKEKAPPVDTYVVQPGDTLWALSRRWGVSIDDIVRLNQIANPNLIQVGQVLCIPRIL